MNTNVCVRISQDDKRLLESAASSAQLSLSEYMRNCSVRSAKEEILERRDIVISVDHWDRLEDWLNIPAEPIEEVQEVFERPPVWES